MLAKRTPSAGAKEFILFRPIHIESGLEKASVRVHALRGACRAAKNRGLALWTRRLSQGKSAWMAVRGSLEEAARVLALLFPFVLVIGIFLSAGHMAIFSLTRWPLPGMALKPSPLDPGEEALNDLPSPLGVQIVSEPLSTLYIKFDGFKTFMSLTEALNPTGGPVRLHDRWGSGEYKAPRADLKTKKHYHHSGIDYVGRAGQPVTAPITGELRRMGSQVNRGAVITGFINGRKYQVKMLHVDVTLSDGFVVKGQQVGKLLNLSAKYPGMTPHVHLEVHEYRGDSLLKQENPTKVVSTN